MAEKTESGAAHSGSVPSSAVLGEMVWLYSMSELHRTWPIGSIHQWLLPALMHKQYRIYHKGKKPVGLVTWARMSAEVETAYVRNTRSLQPKDWASGDRLLGLDLVAPFGDDNIMIHDLRHEVFPDEVGRFLRVRKGDDTLRIMYVHGVNAIAKARDRDFNPTVDLGNSPRSLQ
jgi:cytolysin-activating lysine-acyltransferase